MHDAGIVDDVLRLLVDSEVEDSARKAAGATLKNLAGRSPALSSSSVCGGTEV